MPVLLLRRIDKNHLFFLIDIFFEKNCRLVIYSIIKNNFF